MTNKFLLFIGLLTYILFAIAQCDAISASALNPRFLAEYSLQNIEAMYKMGLGDADTKKIPNELISYACRAFPTHTKINAVCRKFYDSFGVHLMDEIANENREAETSDLHIPCSQVIKRSEARSQILDKTKQIWIELLEENDVPNLTQEVEERIHEVVVKSQNNYCTYCMKFVSEAQEFLKYHQDDIESYLLKLCKKSPSRTVEQVCYVTLLIYGPQVIDYINNQPPQTVCKRFCDNPTISFR